MRRMETVELTNMCMLQSPEGDILMQRRTGNWPGYALPGGHVEYGEAMTDAVKREVFEETGLTIHAPQLCGVKEWMQEDGSRYLVMLYRASRYEGTLASSDEGEVRWVSRKELAQLPLSSGMQETLRVFLDESVSELWLDREHAYQPVMK